MIEPLCIVRVIASLLIYKLEIFEVVIPKCNYIEESKYEKINSSTSNTRFPKCNIDNESLSVLGNLAVLINIQW